MLGIVAYFVLSLAFIILSCLLLVYCFKKNNLRFEQVLPISLMSISLLMFFLIIIFHNIQLSFILTITIQLLALAVFIVLDKRRKKTIVQFLQSPAILVFIALLVALFVVNYGRILTGFDDLIHWGPFVADSLRLNDFYNAPSNIAFSVHGDYPPAAALFEVFFLKLTGNKEWLMFVASQLLCLSMIFPLLSKFSWRKKSNLTTILNILIVVGLIVAALVSVSLQTDAAFFYEIRIDTLLACAGAYGAYTAFAEGKKSNIVTVIKLSILITFMLLLKQVALVIAVVVVAIYITMLFTHRGDNTFFKKPIKHLKKVNKLHLVIVLVAIMLPVISLKLWDTQVTKCVDDNICTIQFNSDNVNFLKVPFVVMEKAGTEFQQETASRFLKYIYTGETLINFNTLKITYPQFILLFCGIMLSLAGYAYKKKQPIAGILVLAGVMLVGYFGYLFLILGTYLYGGFSDGETLILASADRYIGTYILMMILVMVMVFVEVWSRVKTRRVSLFIPGGIALIVFSFALNPVAYKSILPYQFLSYSEIYNMEDFKKPLDTVVSTIKSDKDYKELSVVVLAECNEPHALWESNYLRYELRPNPYMVLISRTDQKFVRNTDYKPSSQYIDPAGRSNTNSQNDISVYVVAMCSGGELEKYNTQPADLIQFDTTTGIKEKWQIFRTTVKGDYYNTLDQRLENLKPL